MTAPVPQSALVDVHAHFLTPRYVAEARADGHEHPAGMPGWPEWDERTHLRLMDRWGVGTSMLSISPLRVHSGDRARARALARHVNETGAAIRARHPDRFGHLASLPLPDAEGALAEAVHALDELGSDGLTVPSNADGVYPGPPRLRAAGRRAGPAPRGRPRPPRLGAARRPGRRRPAASDAGVHLRLHPRRERPAVQRRAPEFRSTFGVDAAAGAPAPGQLGRLWYDMAGTPFPHQIPALTTAFGHHRVLYGSDFCWTPAPGVDTQLTSIDEAPRPASGLTWRALTTGNARRLFPRLAGRRRSGALPFG